MLAIATGMSVNLWSQSSSRTESPVDRAWREAAK